MVDLTGLFPPIPTPFHPDETLNLDALGANLAHWGDQPLDGYVVGGSNGEFVLMTDDERVAVVAAASQAIAGRRRLIAGAGAQSTRRTVVLCQRMAEAGAVAALVVTPHYYKNQMTAAAQIHHFEAVAEASPIPLILYNVPANTGYELPESAVVELSQHANIIGLKDSGGDVGRLASMIRQTPDDFQVLAGSAGFYLPALSVGAVGAVAALANLAAEPMVSMQRRFAAGDFAAAGAIQRRLIEPNLAVTRRFGVAGLKQALDWLGFYGGPVRSPLLPLMPAQAGELRATLQEAELLS